jgi:ABC-2 type transport system permease protein
MQGNPIKSETGRRRPSYDEIHHMPSTIIIPIVRKEFRQIGRDKRILGVLLFIPALMLLMFGYALNFDVKHTSIAVYDEDRTETSRAFARQFWNSEFFDLKSTIEDPDEINKLLDAGETRVILIIPSTFSVDLARGREATVQVLVDGANSFTASTVLGYVNGIIQQYSLRVLASGFQRVAGGSLSIPIDLQPRVWYNPELRSAKYLVPGLVAFILMVVAVVSTSLSIVRERELGTMEQMMVSPIKPLEMALGKTIPYTLISLFASFSILIVGYLLFDVEVRGSYLLLFCVTLIFLLGSLGFGLLISTIAETQQVAFMIAALSTLLPTFILSDFVFPIRNMPAVIQAITYVIPARYFLVALRSIILKGAGLGAFWEQVLMLVVYATITIGVSSIRLKKILH